MKDFVILYFCLVQHFFRRNIIGCLCGTVAAAQMILGFNFGRDNLRITKFVQEKRQKNL
jgi:hypothetical protein